jgi:hypothetical protein
MEEDTSSSSRQQYHKEQTVDRNRHPDRMTHQKQQYKYQADANNAEHNMEPYLENDNHDSNDKDLDHTAEANQGNQMEHKE